MRIEQLFYFVETAKIGSINAASEKLHISQQSLNSTLKNLEKELGAALFRTSNRGIVITEQGQLVIDAAQDILPRLLLMQKDIAKSLARSSITGSLSVHTTPVMNESLLPGILQSFSSHYPAVSISLGEQEHLQILDSVKKAEINLGIMGLQHDLMEQLTEQFTWPEHIRFVPLYQYKIALAVGAQTPLAKYKSISMKTAIRYPIVLNTLSELEDNFTYRWLKLYGSPAIKYTTPSPAIYKSIIKRGEAIGVYPSKRHCGVNVPAEDGIALIPIKGPGSISTVGYLYNTLRPISPAMQALINELTIYCT